MKFSGRGPHGLNLEEINLVNHIFACELAAMRHSAMPTLHSATPARTRRDRLFRSFYLTCLLSATFACTKGHAAPQPPLPPPSCQQQLLVGSVQGKDVNGAPVIGYTADLNARVCGCSDGVVRWGAFCQ